MGALTSNLITLLGLSLFIFTRMRRSRSLIEPGIVFAANLILLYPIRAFALYVFGENALPDYPGASDIQNIANASWIAMIGCIGFAVGYILISGRRRFAVLKMGAEGKSYDVTTVTVLFFLSLLGIAYKIATGDYMSYLLAEDKNQGLSHIGTLLTSLQWPAYIGALIVWLRGNRRPNFILLFLAVMAVVIPYQFLQGSKTFLSLLLVSVVISYYSVRGKLPKVIVLLGVYIVAAYIFPFVHNFRESINSDFGKIPSISQIDIGAITEMSEEHGSTDRDTVEVLMPVSARFSGIDQLYGVMQTVPEITGYRYGFDYSAILVNFVPRLIWPSKPIYSRGADYGSALGTMTSVTPFPVGEAYWDFGGYGVIFMMMIWGACLAAVTRAYSYYFDRSNFSFLIGLYFLSQIYWISSSESSMPMVLSGIPQQIVLLVFAAAVIGGAERFLKKRTRNMQRSAITWHE
jgi:hypothetical protein